MTCPRHCMQYAPLLLHKLADSLQLCVFGVEAFTLFCQLCHSSWKVNVIPSIAYPTSCIELSAAVITKDADFLFDHISLHTKC